MPISRNMKGSLMLLLCAIIWGFAFTAQDILADTVPVFACGAVRSLIAAVALAVTVTVFDKAEHTGRSLFSRKKNPLTKRELLGGAACGAALAIATAFQQAGIATSGASKAAFITAMYVVLVPMAGALIFGRRTHLRIWIAVIIAICGVGLITLSEDLSLAKGDILIFICAFCFCGQILLVDHFLPGSDGIRLSMVQFASGGIMNLILSLIFESVDLAAIAAMILPLAYLGLMSSGCAYTLQILGQRYCPPAPAAILMSTEALFGALGAALVLGEVLTVREYVGCAVVFFAVILSQLPSKKETPA